MPLIRTEKLTKTVPQGHGRLWLLRDVDMHVDEGEFVSIMGPSGAGKTTLLHILGMHDADWEGSFTIEDTKIESLSAKQRADLQRRTVGFVFQSYHLIDDLTVAENLDVPLRYRDVPKRERESIVADVLDRFRIVAKKDLYPSQLSGGQQQLVGIARAIVSNPRVILADEPTGNLHSDQAREIMELFRTLHRGGTTIVQVTHSEENAAYGDRVIRLHDGRVVR